MNYLSNAFSISMLEIGDLAKVVFIRHSVTDDYGLATLKGELGDFTSVVGHADVAAVISGILGVPVPVNRVSVKLGAKDALFVAQYTGPRMPEGATALPEGAALEFFEVRYLKGAGGAWGGDGDGNRGSMWGQGL